MAHMFARLPAPVVGQLVRSGMGTRLWWVHHVLPHPLTPGAWVCAVLPAGHVTRGVWHGPGNTQCSGWGHRALKWIAVGVGAHYPCTPGPACPPMPATAGYTRPAA